MKRYILYFLCLFIMLGGLTGCEKKRGNAGTEGNQAAASDVPSKQEEEPSVYDASSAEEYAEKILKDMSLDEKIGQMMIVDLKTLNRDKLVQVIPEEDMAAKKSSKNKETSKKKKSENKTKTSSITKVTKKVEAQLKKYPVGGIVLFPENMKDKEQTKELVKSLQEHSNYYPLYIATTEEWGDKSIFALNEKLGGTVYPMLSEISLQKTVDAIYNMGKTTGKELKELGINLNMAPVADVANGIKNVQYAKYCYSDDEDEVAEYIENAVRGMRAGGVCTTLTHFPGVGSVAGDYNNVLTDNNSGLTRLRDVDFVPFSSGISAGTDAVMVSHVSVSKVTQNDTPASMSELIVTGILRDELNFDGLILSDSLSSPVITSKYEPGAAVLQAIQAGTDIVVQPANIDLAFAAVREAVSNRSLDERVLNAAVIRILKNKIQRGIIQIDTAITG
ncbi:MAG: hypothetical protein J6I65_04905 [Lachnospiraceae bacterium]|nr:hypothetical protein [Lachnospiraceae bacterium]